jgi:hypothetical protein
MYDKMVSYNLHGPIYHPQVGVIHKNRGICSGSVFTNLIDSISNILMISYSNCITNYDFKFLRVCGDDNLICTDKAVNIHVLTKIAEKSFDVHLTFDNDMIISSGKSEAHFLGSYWTKLGPERPLDRMILSSVKESYNWPDFDTREEFIEGRIYTIFGYDRRLPSFWKQLGFKDYVGRRIYEFQEAST